MVSNVNKCLNKFVNGFCKYSLRISKNETTMKKFNPVENEFVLNIYYVFQQILTHF